MGAFGWYVVILTVGYILYYGIMLAWDQYGVKGQNKNMVEDFEGLDSEPGGTKVVSETEDGGYSIEDDGAHVILDDDQEEHSPVEVPDTAEAGQHDVSEEEHDFHQEQIVDDDSGSGSSESDDDDVIDTDDDGGFSRLRSLQESLPKVVVKYEEEYDSSEMKLLMQQRPEYETRIRKILLRA